MNPFLLLPLNASMNRSNVLSFISMALYLYGVLFIVGFCFSEQTSFYPTAVLYVTAYEDLVPAVQKRDLVYLSKVVEDTVIQVDELIKPKDPENRVLVFHTSYPDLTPFIKSTNEVNVTYVSLEAIIKSPNNYSTVFCVFTHCSFKSTKLSRVLPKYTRLSPIPHFDYHIIRVPPCLAARTDSVALKALGYPVGDCWHIDTHDWDEVINDYQSMNKIIQPREMGHLGLYIQQVSNRADLGRWQQAYREGTIFLEAQESTLQLEAAQSNEPWFLQAYFLVTSFNPLRVYMYKDGYVRHLSGQCRYLWKGKPRGKSSVMLDIELEEMLKQLEEMRNRGVVSYSMVPNSKTPKPYPPCGSGLSGNIRSERLSSFSWLEEQLEKRGKSLETFWQNVERAVVSFLMLAEAKPPFVESSYDQHFQILETSLHIDESGTARLIDIERDAFPSLEHLKDSGFSDIYDNILNDTRNILSYANVSQKVLKQLDSFETKVGYDFVPLGHDLDCVKLGNTPYPDICLTQKDVLYLLRLEMEEQNQGQYRRIYPCSTCSYYTPLLKYIKKKMYGCGKSNCTAHTSRIHRFMTEYSESPSVSKQPSNEEDTRLSNLFSIFESVHSVLLGT